jgi:hypothetical protein
MRRRRNIEGTNSFESKRQRGEMKTLTVSTFAASGLAALCLGLTATAAQAAPSGPINAADVIASLQQQGYHLTVNGTGTTPLDRETVLAVRPGQTYSHTGGDAPGANHPSTSVSDKPSTSPSTDRLELSRFPSIKRVNGEATHIS